ncbi:helix-hairpin-helix domain-containing protein [Synechococcus elongatus]|uniref:Pathogenicity locus n=2 Tax=Synechococcus elongatus TaxID=32046 RepID=Q31LH4_SYNE7|nr:helix-hairpin-helix domain-containing protein [Synechococcus elongatus]ABB58095.1 conserved hypothetical protein [Synechococcus elongatus PCC 7942 = FACHB-805]MBD2586814.1 hypothetical protein [Synechococcus elongatus FACHB-242]MBD2687885.1 hypothetical protein [Synechococcus elongatus FACHB-1061]MBD2706404.1 hypothetical protein [Synechococcus elongatus PCC 7942 = FACHB-805]UOW71888.1 Pathogenicity locus [Synechococcus elongatus PCC 7943]
MKSDLLSIPGIGRTFVKDFARIGIHSISDLVGQDPSALYQSLCEVNAAEAHATSKNYLYVFRMAVYYANGGRDSTKLKWHVWKD